ncbi:MAG TPA: alpha/beta fold hydrolase [Longimicrobium sp.]|nr:alpha/beta fold hydrolase [Longimicrobium sp.]
MPNPVVRFALAGALALVPSLAAAQGDPFPPDVPRDRTPPPAQVDPIRADPPRDRVRPPAMEELKIPSGGARMNGFIYLAQGEGPRPVVVFLHGYPGNERNLDLAQVVRRAGWHALYFDYRGSWGSGGTFSFGNALHDVDAALAFLRAPENRARFRVDTARIVLVGHSMGGWLAMLYAAADPSARCTAGLDVANMVRLGRAARENPGARDYAAYFRQTSDPQSGPIRANADDLLNELVANADRWDFLTLAPALKDRAVFLAASTATDAEAARQAMTRNLAQAGARHVRSRFYNDDHSFSASRIALAEELLRWLRTECAAVQRVRR